MNSKLMFITLLEAVQALIKYRKQGKEKQWR